VKGAD
jgi:hypothetical protein